MSSIANEYERWFDDGHRDLPQFLAGREIDEDEFRECVMTDQYLRHQCREPLNVNEYVGWFDRVAESDSLQLDLWLEALGYMEEQTDVTDEAQQEFLNSIPKHLRSQVEGEIRNSRATNATAAKESTTHHRSPADAAPECERYRIESEIGRGAFGIVYRAFDTQLERTVALKVLHGEQSPETLFAEARLAAGLDVPGIVSVYDCAVEANGRGFLVTAFVDGPDLREWATSLDRKDRERICHLFIRLCESLRHAHEAGIVHRDIKPTNIIVKDDDEPVLLDFGLAIDHRRTGREGELVGTPAYMSPEQARGEGHLVDARSDVFSLGILLFETLTGHRPWESNSSRELVREIAQGQVRSAKHFDTDLPLELERICSKATAGSMSDRYLSAFEFAEDLKWFTNSANVRERSIATQQNFITPRGLRPYTDADAKAFWQLLPGQRNGRGVPDSVQWWMDQLQNSERGPRRNVLVLYGPSGSGKSSLLSAGVVPFLDSAAIDCICIDASEILETDSLASQLFANHWPEVDLPTQSASSLSEQFAHLRENSSRRIVFVLDQFEQVFTWSNEARRDEISLALRQADGDRLQFVLVVRDEFWTAISRLMRELDAPLRDGRNAMALERFGRQHAAVVLRAWASAISDSNDSVAENATQVVSDTFIEHALDLVVEDDRVVPVRLALLASILGYDGWNEEHLHQVTSTSSLSGYYLDSALGSLAPAAKQKFREPAREILRCVTPSSGRLRGSSQSGQQLRDFCDTAGTRLNDLEFADVVDLLERQLHLLIPVEKESASDSSTPLKGAALLESRFQLPHDFLVPEIRSWLDSFDRSTFNGRAVIDRRIASERWQDDQRPENLAGPIDCIRFGLLTRPRTQDERTFVRTSARRQLVRSSLTAGAAFVLLAIFQIVLLKSHARDTVRRLLTSNLDELPVAVADTRQQSSWTSDILRSAWQNSRQTSKEHRDRIALALVNDDPEYPRFLANRLPQLEPDDQLIFVKQLQADLSSADRQGVVSQLAEVASDESRHSTERLKAAIAIGILMPDHSFWDRFDERVSELLVDANPTDLGWLSEGLFSVRSRLISSLTAVLDNYDPIKSRTATFLLAKFAADDPVTLVDLTEQSALNHLSAIFPTVDAANEDFDPVLLEKYADVLDAWQEADGAMLANDDRNVGTDRLAAMDALRVDFARRLGNLGAALIMRGKGDVVLDNLRFRDDPTIRGYLIQCYAEGGGPAAPLVDMLIGESRLDAVNTRSLRVDTDIAAALLQTLGSLPASSQVPISIRELAADLYRSADDAELNATAEWYLRKHGYESDLAEDSLSKAVGYRTSEGHSMVRVPGGMKATVGASSLDRSQLANKQRREITVPEGLYFSRNELTAGQLGRFRADTAVKRQPKSSDEPQKTATRIGFFSAAAYCNWLSEKEGIPKDQWCYLPNEDRRFAPGMTVAHDHLQRSGYQIPTPDLWEYACRGGTSTPRIFGYGTELSSRYIRWAGTGSVQRQRLPARLPNHFGLFDVLGNSAEWTVGMVDRKRNGSAFMSGPQRGPFPPGRFRPGGVIPRRADEKETSNERQNEPRGRPGALGRPGDSVRNGRPGPGFGGGPILTDVAGKSIRENDQFVVLGGAFDSPAHKIRSSDRSIISPTKTNKPLTLRLMRIVQDE